MTTRPPMAASGRRVEARGGLDDVDAQESVGDAADELAHSGSVSPPGAGRQVPRRRRLSSEVDVERR